MGTLTFISKKHLGSGNYEYTYKCKCNNSTNEIKVTSGNSLQAEMLAQMECDEICNSSKMDNQERLDLKQVLEESGKKHENSFIVSVDKIEDSSYSVYLCTGDKVTLPKEVVQSFEFIGILENGKSLHKIAQVTFNSVNEQGVLIQQLANIIEKLTNIDNEKMFETTFNEGEQHLQIKVPCSGRACNPTHSYYTSKKPILQHSLRRVEGCVVNDVTKLGAYKLRVLHSALGGTVCGTNYSGRAYFDIIVKTS